MFCLSRLTKTTRLRDQQFHDKLIIWLIKIRSAEYDTKDLSVAGTKSKIPTQSMVDFALMMSWRHQMESFSACLALCSGNSPAIPS